MTTSVRFPQPKDPADDAWYLIRFAERLARLLDVTIAPEVPDDVFGLGTWQTPGDTYPASMLAVESQQLAPDGLGVAMLLVGGTPGGTYGIRVGVLTTGGTSLYRTAILNVTGL